LTFGLKLKKSHSLISLKTYDKGSIVLTASTYVWMSKVHVLKQVKDRLWVILTNNKLRTGHESFSPKKKRGKTRPDKQIGANEPAINEATESAVGAPSPAITTPTLLR
jgi:hypothetical protein